MVFFRSDIPNIFEVVDEKSSAVSMFVVLWSSLILQFKLIISFAWFYILL